MLNLKPRQQSGSPATEYFKTECEQWNQHTHSRSHYHVNSLKILSSMFRSLLCTQITALTHLENFTWLFICGTNWLFFGTIWLGTNGPDSEGQGRGDWRERDGKAPSLRRVSLSLFSLPFLPFSSVSFFENYLSIVLKFSPFFMPSACVCMRTEIIS